MARKINPQTSHIDKSSFFYVQNCGVCHPGGGWAEYDRKGNRYYDEENKKFGYELSGDDPRFDGDYTSYSMGNEAYGAAWDRTGVSEADCLICHLKGYSWNQRAGALRGKFFRDAPSVGAGWASVKIPQEREGPPGAEEVTVDYTKKEIADFENLHLQIVKRPPDENCWFCHAASDGRKRGRQWSPETDVHKAKDLHCLSCHPSDKDHNFAKGNTIRETVRDDLDQTMPTCEDCHYRGKDKKAPRYKHPFSPRHMKRMACQTCHIPYRTAPADLIYDHASTGQGTMYETSAFLSNNPFDPQKPIPGLDPAIWYPAVREFRGKIVPVKPLIVLYWGDLDQGTNMIRPIPLWRIRELNKPEPKDDNTDGIPEVNSLEEIAAFLKVLKDKDKFGNPVATHPVLVKGGFVYRLGKQEGVEKTKHDQADLLDLSLSHNIMAGPNVVGAGGCKDCHSKNSPFFLRKVLVDPYDEKGKPVYIEAWQRLGIDREKLSRLLLEQ